MKRKLLYLVKMVSKNLLYGMLVQCLLMTTLMANGLHAQVKPIDKNFLRLQSGELTVQEVFDRIQSRTDYVFVYPADILEDQPVITLTSKRQSVHHVLSDIARETGLKFKQVDNSIYVGKGQVSQEEIEISVEPHEIEIKGTVTDSNGDGIPGATVLVEGSNTGTATDIDGNFTLDVPEGAVLLISFIGYQPQRVAVGSQGVISVVLEEDQSSLDEIVVVGYGVQEKLSITNSVTEVSGEVLQRRPVASIEQSLQGIAPGVTVVDQGGRPGSSNVNIRIRGITTLGNNNPLIIVDGIEQRINDINPNDIESITVLKDASSSAIYGSRAANGVVLVTTKRGRKDGMDITYNGYWALQDVTNRPEHMDVGSYLRLENVAHENAGRTIPYSEEYIQEYVNNAPSPEYPLPFPYWRRDELGMLKTAPQQNHTLSISGGSESIRGRLSVRHQSIEGVAPNFSDVKNEFRLNMDMNASSKLRFGADLNYRTGESLQPAGLTPGGGESVVFQYMLHASKFSWPKYSTGEYGLGPQVNNPLLFAELTGTNRNINNYITGSIKFDYDILPDLTFSTQYAARHGNNQIKNFSNRYVNRDPITGRVAQRLVNALTENRNNLTEYTLNSLLTYSRNFNRHGLTALIGYSTVDNTQSQIMGFRQEFYNNDVQSLSQGSNENRNATGTDAEWGLRSYFSRLNYKFSDKYFVELNARYDGSSRFSEDHRYSFFPSFSLGWRLSEETFWDNLKPYVNEFKLRGSRGATGNQAVGLYAFYETLSTVNYSFNDQPIQGFAQTNLANRQLTWETTTQTNLGFDMGILEDRLLLTFDYYNKMTDGILLQLPIPALIGLGAPYQNAGVVRNRGYEIALNYKGGGDLTYDLGLNFSDNQNEVLNLVGTGPYISGSTTAPRFIIAEGLPINSHWGYLTDGFFQTQEEADNYPNLRPNTRPGDVKYLDINDDGIINEEDHENLGLSFPRFDFGLNANLAYKNFDLFFQFQGAAGHKTRLDGAFQQVATFETFTHAIYTNNYWTPERTDAEFARPIKGDDRNFQTSDYQMIDASYLRLKNIVLGYYLPVSFSERIFIKNAKVYVGASNLLTFSELNRWDLDPEIPSGRGQYYPQVSMYTIGANIHF